MEYFIKRYMGVTEFLSTTDLSLRREPEPSNNNYQCFNTGGVECEVGEFLYGLVRMMKPKNVFETGTHLGVSSSYIGQALKDNGDGMLTTVEISRDFIRQSQERWKTIGIHKYIMVDKEYSIEYFLEYDCEIMLLDSEPEFRFKELMRFFDRLVPGGYVFIHDLHHHLGQHPNLEHGFGWPYGKLPNKIRQWLKDDILRPFHFRTPRGLTGFYKVHKDDYKYK